MSKNHLLMVLQTHSVGNSAGKVERFCKASKAEVMRRCTKSLIDSANHASDVLPDFTIELKVLDDHSDDLALEHLKTNLNSARFKTDLEALSTRGIMPSILACYEYGKKHGVDWVYFVQDDYLYEKTAIFDMIAVALQTTKNIGNYTCVFPYNDPYRYEPINTVIQSHIIQAQGRHWRTQIMTGSPFMVHHSILTKEWDVFEAMGKHEISTTMEDETINQLFRTRGYYLFVPIPSLALHMQYESEKDPFINWKEWWDRYEPIEHSCIDKSKRNLLNVGFGGQSYKENKENADLSGYTEITLDIDRVHNPDICADITDLSSLPSESFDCIYASHVLECIDYFSIPSVIKEFNRLLKNKGFARIVVFNLKTIAMYMIQDKMLDTLYETPIGPVTPLDILYSQRYYTKLVSKDTAFHKTGFTKGIVKKISEESGIEIDVKESAMDLILTIKKL